MGHNVCKFVFEQAKRQPGALAVVDARSWLTYADLAHRIGLLAAYLSTNGVKEGQRVISGVRSGSKELVTMLAIASLGAYSIQLNPGWSDPRRANIARQESADWLILEREEDELAHRNVIFVPEKPEEIDLAPVDAADVPGQSPFRAMFVAGGGGRRRTFTLTHASMLARLDLDPAQHGREARIGIVNLYDYFGVHAALRTLWAGAMVGFIESDNPPAGIDILGITQLCVEAEVARLLSEQILVCRGRFPTLQLVELYSDSPEPWLLKRLRESFEALVGFRFGTMEHGILTQATPADVEVNPACAGRVMQGLELQIVDEKGSLQPTGASGRIQVRSNEAYLRPGGQQENEKQDWRMTNQLGHFDESNSLWVLGRLRKLVRIEGEWVNPGLIEQVLKMHPSVNDAIVTVVPDRQGAEKKLVAAVDANDLNVSELFRHCRRLLSGPLPESLIAMRDLPFRSRRQFLAHLSRIGA
jgi:fatty-acyl-CoA synthase